MKNEMSFSGRNKRVAVAGASVLVLMALTGCGVGTSGLASSAGGNVAGLTAKTMVQGKMMGGNQPIVGATVKLYAAGTPASGSGYGVGATPLLTSAVTTDANGNFTITGAYTCPTPAAQVYLVGTGGNPGLTPTPPAVTLNNGYIALMAALGTCPAGGTLVSTYPNLVVNEVTTVAAVWALQQFMAVPAAATTLQPKVGAPTTNYSNGLSGASALTVQSGVIGMNNAFITAKVLADVTTGNSPNTNYAYATPESGKINTVADILAYCVNSDPTQTTNCSQLMSAATPPGATTAADTIQAAWYMAQNPINNITNLYNFVGSTPPFPSVFLAPGTLNSTNSGPATNAWNDTTIAINYAPTIASAFVASESYGVAIDAYGNAWISNTGGLGPVASVAEIGVDGSGLLAPVTSYTVSTSGGAYSLFTTAPASNTAAFSAPKVVAIDLTNNAWIANSGQGTGTPAGSSIAEFTGSTASGVAGVGGGGATSTGYYVGETPWGVAVDGSNNVFVTAGASPSASVLIGRSLGKLAASNGAFTYSTSSVATAPNEMPGGQALLAIDTNSNISGGVVWGMNYNTCKVPGTPGAGNVPWGLISEYSDSTGTSLTGSEAATAASNATVGAGSATNCGSTSVSIGQVISASMANPYGIAIDKNNGAWISDVFTSSLGFDGLTYVSAPASSTGLIPSSYSVINGAGLNSGGTTLLKAGADAVDGNSNVWVANQTAKSVVEATLCTSAASYLCSAYSGTPYISFLTPGQGSAYGSTGAAYGIGFVHNTATSAGIAIDPSGNVWVTNASTGTYTNQAAGTTALGNSLTVVVGAAGPVVTPLSLAIHNTRLGQKP